MVSFGHSSVGAIIALSVSRALPALSFTQQIVIVSILSLLSHYAFDFIPHGHYDFKFMRPTRRGIALLVLDVVGGAGLILLLTGISYGTAPLFWLIFAGLFAANLPDVFTALVRLKKIPVWSWVNLHQRFHLKFMHWHNPRPTQGLKWGRRDIWQVSCLLIAIFLITSK